MNYNVSSVGFNRYFYANVTTTSFYQTSFGMFYRASNMLAYEIGLTAICLLFYMIRFKTPTSFRPYSKLLYLSSFVDLFCILMTIATQVRYKLTPMYSIVVYTGPVSLLSQRGQCYFNYFNSIVPQIQCLLLPILAIYRHSHIKNKIAPSTGQLLTYCCIATIPLIFGLITLTLNECATQEITTDIIQSWYVETPLPEVFVVLNFKTVQYAKVGFIYRKLVAYCPFGLTVCIALASLRLLRREWPNLNEKAKTAHRIFNRIFFVQSMLPFMSMILPNLIMTVMSFVPTSIEADDWFVMFYSWATPLNVVCSLLVIAPYRREITRLLNPCCFKSTNSISSPVFLTSSRAN